MITAWLRCVRDGSRGRVRRNRYIAGERGVFRRGQKSRDMKRGLSHEAVSYQNHPPTSTRNPEQAGPLEEDLSCPFGCSREHIGCVLGKRDGEKFHPWWPLSSRSLNPRCLHSFVLETLSCVSYAFRCGIRADFLAAGVNRLPFLAFACIQD